ncbi:MAG: MFS transporter, partial [Clostridia bacterium]|nr:MFS transporter [Clostridia bacterium]
MARLKESVINAFAFGTIGFVLMMSLISSYYVYFLTDVVGIGAAVVGSLLLVVRIADTISVVVSGGIVEKISLRWGKYRSWLLVAPPIAACFAILMFTNLALPPGIKPVFMGCMYVLAHMFTNLSEVSQLALYPVIATTTVD